MDKRKADKIKIALFIGRLFFVKLETNFRPQKYFLRFLNNFPNHRFSLTIAIFEFIYEIPKLAFIEFINGVGPYCQYWQVRVHRTL